MPGIFDRLNFPSSLSTQTTAYSDRTINTMNAMPKLLSEWQNEDIASANTTGYFKNPVTPYTSNVISITSSIESLTGGTLNVGSVYTAANTLSGFIPLYNQHTDRLSGLVYVNENTATLPHYETAIGLGKVLSHLVFQSDGISNNAVMIGSFGALYSINTIQAYYTTIQPYPTLISNSLYTDPQGNLSCNLSNTILNQMSGTLGNLYTYLVNTKTSDETFFANSRAVVDDYNAVKGFTKMGQTEIELTTTLIGSDKLLSRIT
jgi:hypothetical protein